jgi:hypothetical protein
VSVNQYVYHYKDFLVVVKQLLDGKTKLLYHWYMNTRLFLKQEILKSGKSQKEVAQIMGVSPQSLSGILAYNAPKPDTVASVLLAAGWAVDEVRNIRLGDIYEIAIPAASPNEG